MKKSAWLSWLGLAGLMAALFTSFIFRGATFFQRDIQWVWYPQIEFVVRTVASGTLPWWNPNVGFGLSSIGDPSYQLFYPPTWLNLVLQPWTYLRLFVLGHALLAASGMVALAKRRGVGPLGAFAAGAAFVASGPFLSLPSMFHHFAGLSWMPWTLWALEGVLSPERPGMRPALVLGLVACVQLLAGSGDMCLLTGLVGALLIAESLLRREGRSVAARTGLICAWRVRSLSALPPSNGSRWHRWPCTAGAWPWIRPSRASGPCIP